MKRALLASVVLAISLVPIASAASDRGRHEHRGSDRPHAAATQHQGSQVQHSPRHAPRSHRYDIQRSPSHRYSAPRTSHYAPSYRHDYGYGQRHRYAAPRYVAPRGYVSRSWSTGHYLPAPYRSRHYVVDYRAYRLAPPPRGYHYVRVDNHVVLAAIASGLIADVLFDLFYYR
jgi:Ni/Co efflux regulator RcnB